MKPKIDEKTGRFLKCYPDLTKEDFVKLYDEFRTVKKVGEHLNLSEWCVRQYMKEFEIKRKKKNYFPCDDDAFSEFTKENMYWAGFLAADGNVYKNDIILGLKELDTEHLNKFRNFLNCNKPIRHVSVKSNFTGYEDRIYKSCNLKIRSKKIFEDLIKWNIVPNKTSIYYFPQIIKNNQHISHFIRGYIEGDGCFMISEKRDRVIVAGNFDLINNFKEIINQNCNIITGSIYKNKSNFTLEYSGNIKKIVQFLYKDYDKSIVLDRKFELIKHLLEEK